MTAVRNPDLTRAKILEAAFSEIHRNGFRSAGLDSILDTAGVTKGALYHHFPSKQALGYALVDEVIRPAILSMWIGPLEGSNDPLFTMIENYRTRAKEFSETTFSLGCPLNNLIQEMSPIDEGFRTRLESIVQEWIRGVATALGRGQEHGNVRPDLDCHTTAAFIVAASEGVAGIMKTSPTKKRLYEALEGLTGYLETLRPTEENQS